MGGGDYDLSELIINTVNRSCVLNLNGETSGLTMSNMEKAVFCIKMYENVPMTNT